MMLGDMLAELDDAAAAAELMLGLDDLQLLAGVRAQAEADGVDLADYARAAVQRYATLASDEEWVTLMGLIGRSPDPARTCLRRALQFAVGRAGQERD